MNRKDLMSRITAKIQVEGRSSAYNPLMQKPSSLNPIGPANYADGFGGYAYIGPPPDFGGTYGAYTDCQGRKQVGIRSSKMFSMVDGGPMQLEAELSPKEREALIAQIDGASESHKCPACRSELCISVAAAIASEQLHCPHCASVMDGAMDKVKSCVSKLQEKNMATAVKAANEGTKAGEVLNMGAQGKDLAKEAMKVEPPQLTNPEGAAAAKPNDQKAAQGIATEIKPMDEIAKLPTAASTEGAAAVAAPAGAAPAAAAPVLGDPAHAALEAQIRAKVEAEVATKAKKQKLEAAMASYRARKAASATARTTQASFDAKTLMNLKRELRVMATLDPKKFAEVKKNAKLSAVCAEVEKTLHPKETRAQVRAELKALAGEDMAAAEEAKKELEFVAPEILLEEPVELKAKDGKAEGEAGAAGEGAEGGEGGEGGAEAGAAGAAKPADGEETPEEKARKEAQAAADAAALAAGGAAAAPGIALPAEAMQTEWLASLDTLKGERIEMSLYGEEGDAPYWNVTIDSQPVGRINLADQENPQTIRASFVSDSYADNLGKLIDEMGVKKILPMVKTRMFAHKYDEKEVTARIREKAKIEARAEFDARVGTLRQDFLSAVGTIMVAADKNFYQGEENGHALKGGLFNALVQAGLAEQHAVWAVEAGFESAPEYFEFILAKATELMDMPKDARESLEKTIKASGTLELATPAIEPKEEDLVNRLVKSSVSAIAMGGLANGENRIQDIRSQMGFQSTRR